MLVLLVMLLLLLLLLLLFLLLLLLLLLVVVVHLVKRLAFLMMSVYPMHGLHLGITSGVHLEQLVISVVFLDDRMEKLKEEKEKKQQVEKRKVEKKQLAERKKQGKDEVDKKRNGSRSPSFVTSDSGPHLRRVAASPSRAVPGCCPSGQFARPPRPFVSHVCCNVHSTRAGLFIPFFAVDIPSSPAEATAAIVTRRALHQLGVWSGDQDRIVLAVPTITVSVLVNHVMGRYTIPIVHHDDHDRIFLVRLPSVADMERFHGHTWTWWSEEVFFRRVLRVVHDALVVVSSARPPSGFRRARRSSPFGFVARVVRIDVARRLARLSLFEPSVSSERLPLLLFVLLHV
ncbi:hypothetical protein HU200_060676 [Digitaria exilis]|uniref:Uncharacterized protein n=1 Tax=Digitaria exilis TaxID=1010633 RepID=A0A835A8Y8_9POAL|nr:hypothetical protein HU200_060676 [Digitaria exilis]